MGEIILPFVILDFMLSNISAARLSKKFYAMVRPNKHTLSSTASINKKIYIYNFEVICRYGDDKVRNPYIYETGAWRVIHDEWILRIPQRKLYL